MEAAPDLTKPAPAAPPAPDVPNLWFTARLLPWLLGALMLVVYCLTLNQGTALENFGLVARAEGLLWTPNLTAPVTWLVTLPFGWLPVVWIPLALNSFTALCAALCLVWLARCVALLPHDLTKQVTATNRLWTFTPPPLMTRRAPWLPPLAAVLLCGWQLSFWQNAIIATGEMISLLLFAYVIRCFLEFNACGRDAWLLRGALVYGLAVANDWFLLLFFPVLLLALVWVKRLFLFNQLQFEQLLRRREMVKFHLLWQIPVCWLGGLLVILLPPLLASLSSYASIGFWPGLENILLAYKNHVTYVPHTFLLTFCLIAVLPVFLIGLRFYHFLSGASPLNYLVSAVAFQLVFGFFMLVGFWIMLDAPIGPRRLAPALPTLPLYFLEALSLGFFIGHFLLTSETQTEPQRKNRLSSFERRGQQFSTLTRLLKWAALASLVLLAAGVPATLVCKNLPVLAHLRANPCDTYLHQVEAALPPAGAVLIGSDSFRLTCLQADLLHLGRQHDYLVLNTEALEANPDYLAFLKKQSPGFNLKLILPTNITAADRRKIAAVALLGQLGTNREIYSLPPAPQGDAIAEAYYFEPQGLVCHFQPYPPDAAFAPSLPPREIKENQDFWRQFRVNQLTNLVRQTNPPETPPVNGLLKRFINTFRTRNEPDAHALLAGAYYAGALNDWGVELQKNGQFEAAGDCFADALELNPRNAAAQINRQFNNDYQAGRELARQTPRETAQNLDQYRDLLHVLRDGAVDEPNTCFLVAMVLANSQLYRPAVAQLERVKALDPDRLETYLSLASLFNTCRDYTNCLAAANELLARSPTNTPGMVIKATALAQLKNYSQAIPLLDQILLLEPTNQIALLGRGQSWSSLGQFPTARRDFETLLQINTNDYRAYIALANLDEREHHPASAITNYELFLQYAPPAGREIEAVKARVRVLKTQASKGNPPSASR
jgi:tetratricopeptide (TPR) repeat protein